VKNRGRSQVMVMICGSCSHVSHVVHACMQAGHTGQEGKDCGVKKVGTVFTIPSGLPLNPEGLQYLTLRDLSSHDQDREEGKLFTKVTVDFKKLLYFRF
uniref:Uncharacterized protein n=1 Tax=Mola mola TaxID=94237 RepID=A0A3Q3WIW5_MOLML